MSSLRIGWPDAVRLESVVRSQAGESLTYRHVGATGAERAPAGYRRGRHAVTAGRGRGAFDRLADAVEGWELHRRAGLRVAATGPVAQPGVDVVVAVPLLVIHAVACCRVVYTVDDANRRGFAYGTLPLHPETGEEAFVVELVPDGTVRFVVTQFSRPSTRTGRAIAPVHRAAQAIATRRYLDAARRLGGDRG